MRSRVAATETSTVGPSLGDDMASPLTVVWPLVAGLLAGLVGAIVMNLPMGILPEGYTPPRVAGGLLRGRDPDNIGLGLAAAIHHVAGVGIGGAFAIVELGLESLMPGLVALPVAAIIAAGAVYDFFSAIVLPRAGLPSERAFAVRRQFGVSTAVYAVALAVVFPVALALG